MVRNPIKNSCPHELARKTKARVMAAMLALVCMNAMGAIHYKPFGSDPSSGKPSVGNLNSYDIDLKKITPTWDPKDLLGDLPPPRGWPGQGPGPSGAEGPTCAQIKAKHGSPAPAVLSAIDQAWAINGAELAKFGVTKSDFVNMAAIESSYNPSAVNGSYMGLFQMGAAAATDVCRFSAGQLCLRTQADFFDPVKNATAAMYLARVNIQTAIRLNVGWSDNNYPPLMKVYFMHQQGAGAWMDMIRMEKGLPTRGKLRPENLAANLPKSQLDPKKSLIENYLTYWKKTLSC